jgi:molybdopterin-binding protein
MFRVSEAARVLGVSDDTVRRWADAGRLTLVHDRVGRLAVEGTDLAALVRALAEGPDDVAREMVSARNRFEGLVTAVKRDGVMAQVELQCGRNRVVSLISREAADELGLEVGVFAIASIKSTNVVVERTRELHR